MYKEKKLIAKNKICKIFFMILNIIFKILKYFNAIEINNN
jgi:hypothetical protein